MNVLIYHIGSLGDTLVALPAFRAVRRHFYRSKITLLTDHHQGKSLVSAAEVLEGENVIDDILQYPAIYGMVGKLFLIKDYINLLKEIRRRRFDVLIYLIRCVPGKTARIRRDMFFFVLAGIRKFYGHKFQHINHKRYKNFPLQKVSHQTDELLKRLAIAGISVPKEGMADLRLHINEKDRSVVREWLNNQKLNAEGKPWIAVGPGSKMDVKRWPLQRYEAVVSKLIDRFDIWPVVFGGVEDRPLAQELIRAWGRGYIAAGSLGVRHGVAAMQRCLFYLGNDTGTMHMAVAAGIPCVAIFSSRDYQGRWYPFGEGHIVFRKTMPCEGCMLEKCVENKKSCILAIDTDEVYEACAKMVSRNKF